MSLPSLHRDWLRALQASLLRMQPSPSQEWSCHPWDRSAWQLQWEELSSSPLAVQSLTIITEAACTNTGGAVPTGIQPRPCTGYIVGLTGCQELIPPVRTCGLAVTEPGTAAGEAGAGDMAGLLTVPAARPLGLVRAVQALRELITLPLSLDAQAAVPAAGQAGQGAVGTQGQGLI